MEHRVSDVAELKHAVEICQNGDVFVITGDGSTRVLVTSGGFAVVPIVLSVPPAPRKPR